MNREPVNSDDPQLTAYALGEMSSSERIEFESKLEASPLAAKELESMEEIMGLLSKGLKSEWCSEMNEPNLEALPSVVDEKVIAPVQFNQAASFKQGRSALICMAAAVAAMVLVGAAMFNQAGKVSVAGLDGGEVNTAPGSVVSPVALASVENNVHVPQLFLAEEIDDVASLDLVDALDELSRPVDASYLDSNAMIPASHSGSAVNVSNGVAQENSRFDRVDSYLPPVENGVVRYGVETGLIEGRMRNKVSPAEGSSRVFVRGYVSLDGGETVQTESPGRVLAGFRPISMSGNPVMDSEKDLELIYDFQAVQRDLSDFVHGLPEDSEARAELAGLLERNQAAIAELKLEFSR
ncbi:MAG: hypothetical protein P1U68_07520 [Verrucomicrobiales bacterium]|nr:hypothetical protein [Verrucomicrobiales bacterium]